MRLALAQLNYKIGDFENNYRKIEKVTEEQASQSDLIVFSELCLSGYYPRDLITQPHFFNAQEAILEKIKTLTTLYDVDLIIGLITKNESRGKLFHNSLVWISKGKILYTYHKRLLPVYNIFNEARHFAPGRQSGLFIHNNYRIGFLICEDGWAAVGEDGYECDPVDDFLSSPIDLMICINGSPSNLGKEEARLIRFSDVAKQIHAPLIFVNQVGGNDEIVFDGSSFVLDKQGKLQGCLPAFRESVGIVSFHCQKLTFHPAFSIRPPLSQAEFFYQQTILGLKDYVKKCGFKHVVVGVSGGMDSALTLALAVQALGSENVTGIAMPSRYSAPASLIDAKTLCHNLGIVFIEFSIEEEFIVALKRFQDVFKTTPHSLTEQNIQARLRGRLLMEFSNQTDALVLSTGNKSELSVGYTTLYGDMAGGLNVIGDLYKTDVYLLAHYYNQRHPSAPIPSEIFAKAPSAELALNQKDSDHLPEYSVLDPILKLYIEGDLLSKEEQQACQQLINDLDPTTIQTVHTLVNQSEFKRRQAPPIIRVQRRAFGYGRQFPIAATY